MFEIDLLANPGLQSSKQSKNSISFLKSKPSHKKQKQITKLTKKRLNFKKFLKFPSISLYTVIFVLIVSVIFYPQISKLEIQIPKSSKTFPQDIIVDKVLKIILRSQNDYRIESIEFRPDDIIFNLSSLNMTSIKNIQSEISLMNNHAHRVFGSGNDYSLIGKLPWKILDYMPIISPEMFFQFVRVGENIEVAIFEENITMRGSTSDIISVFLQLANSQKLSSNPMYIHSINSDSLIFSVEF